MLRIILLRLVCSEVLSQVCVWLPAKMAGTVPRSEGLIRFSCCSSWTGIDCKRCNAASLYWALLPLYYLFWMCFCLICKTYIYFTSNLKLKNTQKLWFFPPLRKLFSIIRSCKSMHKLRYTFFSRIGTFLLVLILLWSFVLSQWIYF